jgi:hypothetical protein
MKYTCWSRGHTLFSFLFALPLLIFFGLGIPFFVGFRIFSARRSGHLKSKTFLKFFGKFIIPYNDNRAFYEIFLIFNKIVIVFFKEWFIRETILGNLTVILTVFLLYLIIYLIIHLALSPYNKARYAVLSNLEEKIIYTHISNNLAALIWILTRDENRKILSWLIILYVGITNSCFLIWWFHNYFSFLHRKFSLFRSTVKSRILKLSLKQGITQEISKEKKQWRQNTDTLNEKINKLKILNALLLNEISLLRKSPDDISSEEPPLKAVNKELRPNFRKNYFEETHTVKQSTSFPSSDVCMDSQVKNNNFKERLQRSSKRETSIKDNEFKFIGKEKVGKELNTQFLLFKFSIPSGYSVRDQFKKEG